MSRAVLIDTGPNIRVSLFDLYHQLSLTLFSVYSTSSACTTHCFKTVKGCLRRKKTWHQEFQQSEKKCFNVVLFYHAQGL